VVEVSFYTGTQAELLYTLPAAVTKNTYTAQAILSAPAATAPVATIPAGYFMTPPASGPGKALYLKAFGTIANTAAATFSPALGIDPTPGTIATPQTIAAAYAPAAGITTIWNLELWITARLVGQTGGMTLQIDGRWVNEATASAAAPLATALASAVTASVTGLQGGLAYSLELLGTWSASSASNTTTLNQMFLLGLN
jgi:hypothetical protein